MAAKYLELTETIEFVGVQFPVPASPREVLSILYGDDWNIPNREGRATNKAFDRKIKDMLIKITPSLYHFYKNVIRKKIAR